MALESSWGNWGDSLCHVIALFPASFVPAAASAKGMQKSGEFRAQHLHICHPALPLSGTTATWGPS